jgi:co-chaperonin GroES (HSP10)
MSKGFKPHGDCVMIELCENKTVTEAGIIYESKKNIPWIKGKVLSIGQGMKDEKGNIFPAEFKVDDYVVFDKRNGVESYEGLAVVKIQSIVAIVDKDTEISA